MHLIGCNWGSTTDTSAARCERVHLIQSSHANASGRSHYTPNKMHHSIGMHAVRCENFAKKENAKSIKSKLDQLRAIGSAVSPTDSGRHRGLPADDMKKLIIIFTCNNQKLESFSIVQ